MKSDYEVIKCKLSPELPEVHIYGLADWHIGSKECDMDLINKTVKTILEDPCGYAVIAGDLMDNGLKNSKTNVYEQVMQPWEQKEKVCEILRPLAKAGKILCATDGNHEARSRRECDISPIYDIMARFSQEDLFRPYMCLLMVQFGRCGFGRADSQNTYYGLVIHGASRNKHRKYEMTIEPLDFSVSGHTHQPELASRGKIRIDSRGTAKQVNFKSLIVCPALKHGGYGVQKEYEPTGTGEIQYLSLKTIKSDKVKRMEYHTIQV
jgi:predicted phosphodiesterase